MIILGKLRKGQSILEYTLLLGAIIAVLVAVLLSKGGIRDKVSSTYSGAAGAIDKVTTNMDKGVFGMGNSK
jgi:Flp pilus assembly pilin Flp